MLSVATYSTLHSLNPFPSIAPLAFSLRCPFLSSGFGATLNKGFSSRPRLTIRFNNSATEKENKASVGSGDDLWDAALVPREQGNFVEHLVVMVNGLNGSSNDWKYAAKQFVERLPDKVIVYRSECNSWRLTFDGIDLMGERLAEEVISVVKQNRGVHKISFVAHSLGGLIARYAIGRLYEPITAKHPFPFSNDQEDDDKGIEGLIAGLKPMNFITLASPHLGSRGHKQLPMLGGLPFLERKISETAHLVIGRTGKHLFLMDNDDGNPPLLLQMVDDSDDMKFLSALSSFRRRVAYANANSDYIVGWRTSSIRRHYELPERQHLVHDVKYPHIVNVDKGERVAHSKASTSVTDSVTEELEEMMIEGLNKVSWERVDVSFQKSILRFDAHNDIQVKIYWLNSGGVDVIFHMIDNFIA